MRGRYADFPVVADRGIGLREDIVSGSNVFYVVGVNEVIRKEGLRTANPADLERVLRKNVLNLRGFYEDTALVLRTEGDSYEDNDYLVKSLAGQLKKRRGIGLKNPWVIPLAGLDLVSDGMSAYGLAFRLRADAKVIEAPQLAHENNQKRFSQADRWGLPIFNENGDRTLYTRKDGISKLSLYGEDLYSDADLYSDPEDLGGSTKDGRVIIVKDAA